MVKKILLIALFVSTCFTYAQTRLPALFNDGMVLQRNQSVKIWGTDNAQQKIEIYGSWGQSASTKTNSDGNWQLTLKTPEAGGPFLLTIKGSSEKTIKDVMIGEVWLCSGQSNMEMKVTGYLHQPINGSQDAILNSANTNIRMFTVKRNHSLTPLTDVEGTWKAAHPDNTGNFSATAYFFAKKLEKILKVPIGLIHSSWGGSNIIAWMDAPTLKKYESVSIPTELPKNRINQTPTLLYNAMIYPLIGYTINGSIWYQGESNRNAYDVYADQMNAMVTLWRNKWNQGDFSFYYAQIAPYGYNDTNSAFIRESQMNAMKLIENSGMAVTMDIGECRNIHPAEKRLVGERLAYWALANDYNIKGIVPSGPIYKSHEIKDGKIHVDFDFVPNGFAALGKKITGFEIAGEDKIFYPAEAVFNFNSNSILIVSSEKVTNPVSVRYAFDNCSEGTLFNIEGLPASSFRTDDWEK